MTSLNLLSNIPSLELPWLLNDCRKYINTNVRVNFFQYGGMEAIAARTTAEEEVNRGRLPRTAASTTTFDGIFRGWNVCRRLVAVYNGFQPRLSSNVLLPIWNA